MQKKLVLIATHSLLTQEHSPSPHRGEHLSIQILKCLDLSILTAPLSKITHMVVLSLEGMRQIPLEDNMDLLINKDTGDLAFLDGMCPVTRSRTHAVAQRVYVRLRTFLGEWYLSESYGTPWLERVL